MKKFLLILAAVFCCTLGANAQETPDYFCLTFTTSSTIQRSITVTKEGSSWVDNPQIEYNINGAEDWHNVGYGTAIDINDGDKVYFRAGKDGTPCENTTFSESTTNYICFNIANLAYNVDVSASGNIMSLLDGEYFESMATVPKYAFYRLFTKSTTASSRLMDISKLRLPATTVSDFAYSYLFYKCTSITEAPTLPAATLGEGCYSYMFSNCSSLRTAPALPAKILAESCYDSMFEECGNLTVAPILPATTLTKYCYRYMFYKCSSLNNIEVYFAKWPQTMSSYSDDPDYQGTYNWVSSVPTTGGEFICPEELSHTTSSDFGYNRIPGSLSSHWTISYVTTETELNDNEPYTGVKDKTTNLTYNRTFATANLWEPLYVPFSINITADLLSKCDIADIYMVSKGSGVYSGKDVTVVRKMSAEETTIAHTPYFIRAKASGDFTFTQENTLLKAAPQTPSIIDCSTTKDKYEFIGSYSGETLNPASGDFYILDAEGALTKISEETTLPFNRWYMKKTSRQIQPIGANLSPLMPILTIGEDDTTGIIGLDEVKTNANGKLYNMMGVAVEAGRASLPAGVYIQHGKKFIVK